MARVWRLRPRGEFERVRLNGRAWPQRYFVIIIQPRPAGLEQPPRFGIAAGKRLGPAVTRNRIKRQLREAVRQVYPSVSRGIDVIIIARAPIVEASGSIVVTALCEALQKAHVWRTEIERDEIL